MYTNQMNNRKISSIYEKNHVLEHYLFLKIFYF